MSRRAVGALVLAISMVTACQAAPAAAPSSTTPPGPASYDVQVDAKATPFNMTADAYFPNELTVHPGDTVRFTSLFRGAPHTVTFGTLVGEALASIDAMAKSRTVTPFLPTAAKFLPPAAVRVPDLLTPPGPNRDTIQSAAAPCFLATGAPSTSEPCAKELQQQPEFDGKQAYYNSGFMPDKAVFSVKFSDATAPGQYQFWCNLHRDLMTGTVTVVPKTERKDTPEAVKARAAARLDLFTQKLQPLVDAARKATPDKALAGVVPADQPTALGGVFGPTEATIPVGGTMSWTVNAVHTISFNPTQDAVEFLTRAADGTFHLNPKILAAANGPGLPPLPPEGTLPPPIVIDGGAWDGKGFKSSGALRGFSPSFSVTYKLTFTQPGTYKYVCLIHFDMEGTVKVLP